MLAASAAHEAGMTRAALTEIINDAFTTLIDPERDPLEGERPSPPHYPLPEASIDRFHLEETAHAHDKSTYQPHAKPWIRELNTVGLLKVATAVGLWKDGQLLCVDCGKPPRVQPTDLRSDCRWCGAAGNPSMIAATWFWKKRNIHPPTPPDWTHLREAMAELGLCSKVDDPG